MLGDDASMVFMELIKRLLEIIKTVSDGHYRNSGAKTKQPKKPKIKMGKLSKADFNKLRDSGTNFSYVTLPKEKLADLERDVKRLGGSFFATKLENGNNAVVAVPQQYMEMVSTAMKHIVADEMCSAADKLKIKDGEGKVDEADMKLTADILRGYDIPVYSFKSSDGRYMNVVPDEFDGQYEAAMKEVRTVSEQLKKVQITKYEQTSPLDSLDVFAVKLSPEAAKALYMQAKEKGLDVKFAKDGEQDIAVYPSELKDEIDSLQQNVSDGVEESEQYLIDVKDNTVTMDIGKLLAGEDEATYFVRVPNTAGRDYMYINKSDVELINDNKTISMKLDMKKSYRIFDAEGNLKTGRTGAQLSRSYNTKSMYADKNTEVVKYGVGMERVELYNKEQNKLISLGIDSADKIRSEMLEQGISARAAERLLADIDKQLPDNYKSIFNYTAEKTEIVYDDIPNIGQLLAQCQLAHQVIGKAECVGELPQGVGEMCCVFDESSNKYAVLTDFSKDSVLEILDTMGFEKLTAERIADRVAETEDIHIENKQTELAPKTFEASNPELANMMYHNTEYGMLIVQESGEQYRYMDIDKGTPREDVEKVLLKNFDIKDEMSAADIMKQLVKEGVIEAPAVTQYADVSIEKISTNLVEISHGGQSAVMPKDKLDRSRLEDIGLDKKTADGVIKTIGKSDKQTLQQLKRYAANAIGTVKDNGGKLLNSIGNKLSKGQDR